MPDTRDNAPAGGNIAHALSLTVPSPWYEAVQATTAALRKRFPAVPPAMFAPHISLCQSFCTAESAAVVRAVEGVVRGLPPTPVRVGGVRCFTAADGSPLVIYVEARAPWLQLAHQRLLREIAPYRSVPHETEDGPGNPAFDLEGYTPHITLLFARYLPTTDERRRAAKEAAALWTRLRPPGEGFTAAEVLVSAYEMRGDPALAEPRLIAAVATSERGNG